MKDQICAAIRDRRMLQFIYDGEPRTVEPYVVGKSRRDNEMLSAYQVGGRSATSGEPLGWKNFDLGKIQSLIVLDARFQALRPGYNPDDRNMVSIDCRAR